MIGQNKGTLGKPIYNYGDFVRFSFDGQVIEGVIGIIDAYGTMEQNEEPSYDIKVGGENFTLYKHIPESQIVRKIMKDETMAAYWRALLDCRRILQKTIVIDEGKNQLLIHVQEEIERVSELLDSEFENVEENCKFG